MPLQTPDQIALDLPPPPPAYDRAGFVITGANSAAFDVALRFASSPEPAIAVCGPTGAGKTHLLHIVAAEARGAIVHDLANGRVSNDVTLLAIDDAQRADPSALLDLIQARRSGGLKTVLAGAGRPGAWAGGLRDLRTRLEAMPSVELGEPDEELLQSLIGARFRSLQLRTRKGVAAYAAPRIPRTCLAALRFVEGARAESVASGRPVSLALAKKVIENLFEAGAAA